jgi:CMP-2-keto-3-deoxyoctulosonic acid synthetase
MSLTSQQIVDNVLAQIETMTAEQPDRLAEARTKLALPPAAGKREAGVVNLAGDQAIIASELIAEAAQLAEIAKAASDKREQIKNTLRDILGKREVLKVNGAEVFTNKANETRRLNQAAVKSHIPDVPGNEWAYETVEIRSARFK